MTDEFDHEGTVKAPGLAKDAFRKGNEAISGSTSAEDAAKQGNEAVPGSAGIGEITLEDFSEIDMSHPDSVGEYLVSQGLIDRHQLFNALNRSYSTGDTLIEAVIALGYLKEADIASVFRKRK